MRNGASDVHVQLAGISKRYGGTTALDAVSLDIRCGEVHALVGENGAGKSTLGKVIAGVITPDSGTVSVDGKIVRYRSPHDALGDGIAMVAQELSLVPRLSVIQNVFLGREPHLAGVTRRRALREAYKRLTDDVGFFLPPDAVVSELRVATQQKVEILRALARDARLIVMDEPTASLTGDEAAHLAEDIRRLRESGTSLVFVSHNLEEVLELADRISVLKEGRLVATREAAGVLETDLVELMLGRAVDAIYPPKRRAPANAAVVLAVHELTRRPAFNDISFEIRAGEIVGLAGLVGSGRTEVARAIFGADRFERGERYVDQMLVTGRTPKAALATGIALLPESRKDQGLILSLNVPANVTLPDAPRAATMGILRRAREAAASQAALDSVGVNVPNKRAGELSGGNQQRLLLAKSLVRQPRVLIADQPTRGIDIGARHAIYMALTDLAARDLAILLISDEIDEVLGLAHRVLVMRRGAIVAELDGFTATEDDVLNAAFALASPESRSGGG